MFRQSFAAAIAALFVGLLTTAATTAAPVVSDPGQGVVTLSSGATAAAELSGITYVGGSTYYAVGDNGASSIWEVTASIDTATGRLTGSPTVTGSIAAPGMGTDSEGIAYRSTTSSCFIADEVASCSAPSTIISPAMILPSDDSTRARCKTFSSSRTFPGHP